jgi:hypothetical protein
MLRGDRGMTWAKWQNRMIWSTYGYQIRISERVLQFDTFWKRARAERNELWALRNLKMSRKRLRREQ